MAINKTRVTLKTIADQCGYSVNTVSRALRNDQRLSTQTISKIQSTADQLGYIRNSHASSLRSGRSNIIAIITEELLNPHYSLLTSEIDRILHKIGYQIMIFCTYLSNELISQAISTAVSNSVDGILFFPSVDDTEPLKQICDHNIPVVLVDREISEVSADIVRCDDYEGGYLAGKELCRLGHKRFLYIAGPHSNDSQLQREAGFRRALQDNHIPLENLRIAPFKISELSSPAAVMEFLRPLDYTAIFAFNDQVAYLIQTSLLAENYRIPEDISLIGFDYIRQGFTYLPPLTSIACESIQNMAQTAVSFLLRRIEDPSLPPQREVLPVNIYDGWTIGENRT